MRALWTGAATLLVLLGSAPAVASADHHGATSYRRLEVGGNRYELPTGALANRVFDTGPPGDIEVTFVYRDRAGSPTTAATTFVLGVDVDVFRVVSPDVDGTARVLLPHGHYHVDSTVDTPRPGTDVPATSVLVTPDLAVSRDGEVLVDAAVARPVSISVPDRRAVGSGTVVAYIRPLPRGPIGVIVGSPDVGALFTAHTGPVVPGFSAVVSAQFARPGPGGPLVYATGWRRDGSFFTGFHHDVAEAELATVRADHDATAPGRRATKTATLDLPPFRFGSGPVEYPATPFSRVERYAGDAAWANVLEERGPDGSNAVTLTHPPVVHRPGSRSVEHWNRAPSWPAARVARLDDTLVVDPALYGDDAGNEGTSDYRRAHVSLSRDGVPVGESDVLGPNFFAVPPEPARYRLAAEADRDFTDLATRTSAVWTFTSATGHVGALPTVRYQVRGPVLVVHAPDATSLEVEVSYDSGRSWRPVALRGARGVIDPSAGPVSLRARASGRDGDTVEQTTIDAVR